MTALTVDTKIPAKAYYFTEKLEGLDGAIPLDMIYIEGGRFMMGAPEDEPEARDSEKPQHEVDVQSFFIGRYPITQAQWRVVAQWPKEKIDLDPNPSRFKGNNLPVEQVNWYEAVEFCERLHTRTKRPYQLPSEAQWEYACRAGTTTPFAFGQTLTTEISNYNGNFAYNGGTEGEHRQKTTPVDYFGIANGYGLCDMYGNVWEWCADHWHSNYEDAPVNDKPWLTDNESATRVLRGGSWFCGPRSCRSAFRSDVTPEFRYFSSGFRVSCPAPRTLKFPAG